MSDTKEPIRFPDGMIVYCAHTRMVDVDALVPNPANENSHPPEQIAQLAKIMKYNGVRNPITVSTRSGFMSKGHGRLLAAKLNGWKQFPVDDQFYENEAAEAADRVADNKIAELSITDDEMLQKTILTMPDGFDLELMGIPKMELAEFPELAVEDRQPFQQMTFTLHDDQAAEVKKALEIAGGMGAFEGPNENRNGNQLARVCETFNTKHG